MLFFPDKTERSKRQHATGKCSAQTRRQFVRDQCTTLHQRHSGDDYFYQGDVTTVSPARRKRFTPGLFVDDKHKLLFCDLAKVGCTTFKYILISHSDAYTKDLHANGRASIKLKNIHSENYLQQFGIKRLHSYDDKQIIYRLKNYRKVMAVRDPLLRMYSSYREKLTSHGENVPCHSYFKNLGHDILEKIRGNLTAADKICAKSVTFREFGQYLGAGLGEGLLKADAHWNEYYKRCFPCAIDYDYYIRMETGDSDQRHFIKEYLQSNDSTVRLNDVGKTPEKRLADNDYVQVQRAFSELDHEDFNKLYNHWYIDSKLFGYSQRLNGSGLVSTCRSTLSTESEQCC